MNNQKFLKIGLILSFTLCACSTSTVSVDDVENSSSGTGIVLKNSSSSNFFGSSSGAQACDDVSSGNICFEEAASSPNPIEIERTTIFEKPSVSAVIFRWDTTQNVYDFDLVVDGNYLTYAMVEAANVESLVYEFRWNNEDSTKWDRIEVSNTPPVQYINESTRTFSLKELCRSYASARIIWTDKNDNKQFRTEWSDPVGPLYTLTQDTDDRTEFAKGLAGVNPCKQE